MTSLWWHFEVSIYNLTAFGRRLSFSKTKTTVMNCRICNTEDKNWAYTFNFRRRCRPYRSRLDPLAPPLRHWHSTAEPPQISRTRNAIKQTSNYSDSFKNVYIPGKGFLQRNKFYPTISCVFAFIVDVCSLLYSCFRKLCTRGRGRWLW